MSRRACVPLENRIHPGNVHHRDYMLVRKSSRLCSHSGGVTSTHSPDRPRDMVLKKRRPGCAHPELRKQPRPGARSSDSGQSEEGTSVGKRRSRCPVNKRGPGERGRDRELGKGVSAARGQQGAAVGALWEERGVGERAHGKQELRSGLALGVGPSRTTSLLTSRLSVLRRSGRGD